MSRSRGGFLAVTVALLAVGASVPVAFTNRSGLSAPRGRPASPEGESDLPPALARHLERLKALPGNGGESLEAASSAAEASFQQRAFPDEDIPLARIAAARAAFKGHKGKGFPKGKGRPGVWVTIGPSEALYPFFPLRTSSLYVPNEYVAGGRTTSLALAGDCDNGHCRLY